MIVVNMKQVLAVFLSALSLLTPPLAFATTAPLPYVRPVIASDQHVGVMRSRVARLLVDLNSVTTDTNGKKAETGARLQEALVALDAALAAREIPPPVFAVSAIYPYGRYVYNMGAEIDGIVRQLQRDQPIYSSNVSSAIESLKAASAALQVIGDLRDTLDARVKRYVDCGSATLGSGAINSPWNSLAQVNSAQLWPGDILMMKRGVTCKGTLQPAQSGSIDRPITVRSWGKGTARPVIDANGASQAVYLHNVQYWELNDLELVAGGDGSAARRGVYAVLEDFGVGHGYLFNNLYIHDVRGILQGVWTNNGKFNNASGGIVMEVKGSVVKTHFDGVLIQGNHIHDVDRQGIYTWTAQRDRAQLGASWNTLLDGPRGPWNPQTRLVIRDNTLQEIGGDGIVPKMTAGAIVEANILDGFRRRSTDPNAGMWSANSDATNFRYNDTGRGLGFSDGMSYDIDHSTNDVVFQYNYSHDNAGGFMLLCTNGGQQNRGVVRFNISHNDQKRLVQDCGGQYGGFKILSNTFISEAQTVALTFYQPGGVGASGSPERVILYSNNLFLNKGAAANMHMDAAANALVNLTFDHSLFFGYPWTSFPPLRSTAAVFNSPLLDCRARPMAGSAAVGFGDMRSDLGPHDFYGTPLVVGAAVNIGAVAGGGSPACK